MLSMWGAAPLVPLQCTLILTDKGGKKISCQSFLVMWLVISRECSMHLLWKNHKVYPKSPTKFGGLFFVGDGENWMGRNKFM